MVNTYGGTVLIFQTVESQSINAKLEKIMSTNEQVITALTLLTTKIGKIGTETQTLLDRITDLTNRVAELQTPSPALQAALDAALAQANVVDALVTDAAPAPDPVVDPAPVDPVPAPAPDPVVDPVGDLPVDTLPADPLPNA